MKKSKLSFVFAALVMVFLTAGTVHYSYAGLTAVGPTAPNGFPAWYQDATGLQLQLCLDPVNCIPDPVDPANPESVIAGFNAEAFWWSADALIDRGLLTPAILVLALEAAWANELPQAGAQMSFGRIRVRIDSLVAGQTYTITHPFGTLNLVADPDVTGGVVNVTDDIGCFPIPGILACDFGLALFSNIGPNFLRAVTPPPPAGFIGNPGIDQTVTGSVTGNNLFSAVGPNVGGPGINTITTDLFAAQGQVLGLLSRFQDVPNNHPFFTQIEAIATAGITGGCSAGPPPLFCPESPVTRQQMAVFIETSLGRTAPPACTGTRFTDVTPALVGAAACNFIEAFANAGITSGCTPTQFCPNDTVTRGQMAVFIESALGRAPTACSNGVQFADVTSASPFCAFIEQLAADGITGGCTTVPRNFCPNSPVTRGEMAVFIVAAPAPLLP